MFVGGKRFESGYYFGGNLTEIGLVESKGDVLRIDSTNVEEVIDETNESGDAFGNVFEGLNHVLGHTSITALEKHVNIAINSGHGGTEFVGC